MGRTGTRQDRNPNNTDMCHHIQFQSLQSLNFFKVSYQAFGTKQFNVALYIWQLYFPQNESHQFGKVLTGK